MRNDRTFISTINFDSYEARMTSNAIGITPSCRVPRQRGHPQGEGPLGTECHWVCTDTRELNLRAAYAKTNWLPVDRTATLTVVAANRWIRPQQPVPRFRYIYAITRESWRFLDSDRRFWRVFAYSPDSEYPNTTWDLLCSDLCRRGLRAHFQHEQGWC